MAGGELYKELILTRAAGQSSLGVSCTGLCSRAPPLCPRVLGAGRGWSTLCVLGASRGWSTLCVRCTPAPRVLHSPA